MERKGFLKVEKVFNTNYYTAALPQKRGMKQQISWFLKDVVGLEKANLELVREAVERRLKRKK